MTSRESAATRKNASKGIFWDAMETIALLKAIVEFCSHNAPPTPVAQFKGSWIASIYDHIEWPQHAGVKKTIIECIAKYRRIKSYYVRNLSFYFELIYV